MMMAKHGRLGKFHGYDFIPDMIAARMWFRNHNFQKKNAHTMANTDHDKGYFNIHHMHTNPKESETDTLTQSHTHRDTHTSKTDSPNNNTHTHTEDTHTHQHN